MAHVPFLLALLAAQPAAATSDGAGNRMVSFSAAGGSAAAGNREEAAPVRRCLPDRRLCGRLEREGDSWRLVLAPASGSAGGAVQVDLPDPDGDAEFALWPQAIMAADGGVLIGVQSTRRTGYAGGGASAARLVLFRVGRQGEPRRVLDVALGAAKDIRACFGARDRRARLGACSDQYDFSATLTLDPANRAGPPRLLYSARARTYPGRRSLDSDSTTQPPLRRIDLRWMPDPACSYRRTFAYDPARREYVPDRAPPDCADYLDF